MTSSCRDLLSALEGGASLAIVTIVKASGSTPREVGAFMIVTETAIAGTIGGGALEFDAIGEARGLFARDKSAPWLRLVKDYPLGPALNQCCGGFLTVLIERVSPAERAVHFDDHFSRRQLARPMTSGEAPRSFGDAAAPEPLRTAWDEIGEAGAGRIIREEEGGKLWFIDGAEKPIFDLVLYGAGHVAREVVRILGGLKVGLTWVDNDVARFPENMPDWVQRLVLPAPDRAAAIASPGAHHLVMTHSHALDLEICHAILKRGEFGFLGLIGSKTKKNRMWKRLLDLGVAEETLGRMTCPIGVDGVVGKEPTTIAVAAVAQLLSLRQVAAKEV